MLNRKELVVNNDYQRASGIWPDGPSSYFIDTILEEYPFPKIYMYEFLDRGIRGVKKELVDGQQRIKTIVRFSENKLRLKGDSKYSGMLFSDLDIEDQDKFLSYAVSVDVIRSASRTQILQMFRRMNAFTMPLNEAEKRHSSFQGYFKWSINELTDEMNEMFVEYGVFTNRQIIRMSDAELLNDCILAMERGVISTSANDLRGLYSKYDENFPEAENYSDKLTETFDFIAANFSNLRRTYMMKPYALHSLITALIHCKFGISELNRNLNVDSLNDFCTDRVHSAEALLALAQAHEAKEVDGPYSDYVTGCLGGTNRAPNRQARVKAILTALGANVPKDSDASTT